MNEAEKNDPIRALVVLSDDLEQYIIDAALGEDPSLVLVDHSDGLDHDWQGFLAQPSDIVIVACESYSDRAAHMIDRAAKHRPDRPVVLISQSSPNGLLRQAFEAGADDVVALPQPATAIRFVL